MKNWTALLCLFALAACKKPYTPPPVKASPGYLVVEGVINTGTDLTSFSLSKTVPIAKDTFVFVTGATVTVEDDHNNSYPLYEDYTGNYISFLNLDPNGKYRLRVLTADNKQYLSDFVQGKSTPPIDSIGYTIKNNGIQLYTNTHDPTNSSKYYRWDYVETWKFHAKYQSVYYISDHQLLVRPNDQQVYYCYQSSVSSNIVLGSSADLKQDVIYQNPITFVDATSEKLETEYSIIVRQYALTNDAYSFFVNLKKNTEQLGSIFDAQPSQLNGNIHSVQSPLEPVIGYISVTNTQSKRIFIKNQDLPSSFFPTYPYACEQDTAAYFDPKTGNNEVEATILEAPPGVLDVTTALTKNGAIVGYLYSIPICADCTLRGGTIPPYFWQ